MIPAAKASKHRCDQEFQISDIQVGVSVCYNGAGKTVRYMSDVSIVDKNQTLQKSLSVLVVDDEETVCNVVSEILETLGIQAHRAYSAEEALTFLEEKTPDLILTDVMMPDIDGLTLIYKIRCATESSNVPIVVFSAIATSSDREAALKAGASAFLAKPFSSTELKTVIRPLLPSFQF